MSISLSKKKRRDKNTRSRWKKERKFSRKEEEKRRK
jgi:hypothetical protein